MAAVIRLQNSFVRRLIPTVNRRFISTSEKKKSDTATIDPQAAPAIKSATAATATTKNWVSYGFNRNDEVQDRRNTHAIFFASVTVCLVFIGFYMAYLPDYNLRDWSVREAFLELNRREKFGLPLVDPNLIDPSKVVLPSDEELGDTEIII